MCPRALLTSNYNGRTMEILHTRMAIVRAQALRAMGLSLFAVANATGLDIETTTNACQGIRPAINLPDLPGVSVIPNVAQTKHPGACPDHVIAQIRQMRAERHTRANIARTLGVSVATVSNYAPIGPNSRPVGVDARAKVTPQMHREICRLRYVEFMSFAKISAKLGISQITARRYVKITPQ